MSTTNVQTYSTQVSETGAASGDDLPIHILEDRLRRIAKRRKWRFKKHRGKSESNPLCGKYCIAKLRDGTLVGSSNAITLEEAGELLGVRLRVCSSSCPAAKEHASHSPNCATANEVLDSNERCLEGPASGSEAQIKRQPTETDYLDEDEKRLEEQMAEHRRTGRFFQSPDLFPWATTWARDYVSSVFPNVVKEEKERLLYATEAGFLAALKLSKGGLSDWKAMLEEAERTWLFAR